MNNEQERKFNIIIPLYNVEKWIKYCIRSVKAQEYGNFHCYLVDDISTDNTSKIIKNEIEGDNRFTLIENKEKKYALLNIHDTIELAKLDANDVVVLLDGDDWFPNKTVLQNLNRVYFPSLRFIAFKLLQLHGIEFKYKIPFVRTPRKLKAMEQIWDLLI